MITITASEYQIGAMQADGVIAVRETHYRSGGFPSLTYDYFCPPEVDPSEVMSARAAKLAAEFQRRALVDGLSDPGVIPWTKLQFERRFTLDEWIAVQDFNAAYAGHPALTQEQKNTIRRGLAEYDRALEVSPADPAVAALLGLYEVLGVLPAGAAARILGNG